ncbi:glycoside hydrolase family 2 protein [Halobacillus sp. Marseille-Q1614]|uniref:glycoside hydrolase family 2 protein n=1 Tax=Halobacillus sp. Marseille-Q1614 TaxID=2709134 RepID=UPI00156D5900|nr:sugar-binding domain-containing protein [Halobacillus sp. Marseille-Q1614]
MREKKHLNGAWDFQIDPLDKGETEDWYRERLKEAKEVIVPHIWQSGEEGLVNYCGTAWYQRKFFVEELHQTKDLYLCFEAVDFHARVWVNGKFAGEHEGGFTPFEFNVTDHLIDGENLVTVRVYDPEDNAEIPIGKQGSWYTRVSGIWQRVYLEERSRTFIESVFITPNLDREEADVFVKLNKKPDQPASFTFTVTNHLDTETVVHEGIEKVNDKTLSFNLPIKDPILWEPENPHLYDLSIRLTSDKGEEDRKTETFGMREVAYQEGKILFNRKELFLRGALDQAFYPDTIYTAPSDEFIQKEIRLAKEMGFNMLRKHIKIEIPRYLYWADRMGLFIWEEPPNYVKWTKQGRDRFTNDLVSMVKRDYNHPSILIWSLYNEEWGLEWDLANDKEKQSHVEKLYDEIKTLDSSRLICDNSGWRHVKTDINDYHRYFVAPDQIDAWQQDLDEFIVGDPGKNFVDGRESNREPIIVSEFGIWGLPGVKKLEEYYQGQPWWFINQGDNTHKADYKSPLTAEKNFQNYGLNKTFNSFEELAVSSQKRMFRGIKSIIEEMRKRPAIKGYIVTEFTDIEWETNGWLDYLRNPKEGFERLIDFNGDLVVMLDNVNHNLWCNEQASWDVVISNHRLCNRRGVVTWELSGTELSGEIPVSLQGDDYIRLEQAITFNVPEIKKSDFYKIKLELLIDGETVAENYEELTISVKEKADNISVYPYSMDERFVRSLEENGFQIKNEFHDAGIVITSNFDKNVEEFAHHGGEVIFLAEEGDQLAAKGSFTFRHLPEGESWQRTASFNFVNQNEFPDIPLRKEMGWEVEGIIPRYIIPLSAYHKEGGTTGRTVYMFGNSGLPKSADILSGYFEGWIGQGGASMIKKQAGKGRLTLTTWQVLNHYNNHPIATQIVNHLIKTAGKA